MLTDLLKTKIQARGRVIDPTRKPGLSCSMLFPCPYALYRLQKGDIPEEELTAQQILNMENGWTAEEESVRILKEYLGVTVRNRQAKVTIGKSNIPGKIDGEIELDKVRLWEHKAWASSRFDWFVSNGIDAFPSEKTQVNAYMLGRGLDECIFYVKRKENNDYHDQVVPLDKDYILPVIEWADKIRLEGWVPEPKLCKYCAHCGFGCFGKVLDFSNIIQMPASEMAEKWKQGDSLIKVGTMLVDEARMYFTGQVKIKGKWEKQYPGLIGDQKVLLVEGLKVQKIDSRRFDITREAVLEAFGTEGLLKVGHNRDIVSYRITDMEG